MPIIAAARNTIIQNVCIRHQTGWVTQSFSGVAGIWGIDTPFSVVLAMFGV